MACCCLGIAMHCSMAGFTSIFNTIWYMICVFPTFTNPEPTSSRSIWSIDKDWNLDSGKLSLAEWKMDPDCRCTVFPMEILSRELTYPPDKAYLKMIFLFPRLDMLISWRVFEFLMLLYWEDVSIEFRRILLQSQVTLTTFLLATLVRSIESRVARPW